MIRKTKIESYAVSQSCEPMTVYYILIDAL